MKGGKTERGHRGRETNRGEKQKGEQRGRGMDRGGQTRRGDREGGRQTGMGAREGGRQTGRGAREGGRQTGRGDRQAVGVGTCCSSSLVASFTVDQQWGAISVHWCSLSAGTHCNVLSVC